MIKSIFNEIYAPTTRFTAEFQHLSPAYRVDTRTALIQEFASTVGVVGIRPGACADIDKHRISGRFTPGTVIGLRICLKQGAGGEKKGNRKDVFGQSGYAQKSFLRCGRHVHSFHGFRFWAARPPVRKFIKKAWDCYHSSV